MVGIFCATAIQCMYIQYRPTYIVHFIAHVHDTVCHFHADFKMPEDAYM